MNHHFDAISYAQALEAAGVPKAQAEVHAQAVDQALSDARQLPAQLESTRHALSLRIQQVQDGTHRELDALTAKIDRAQTELQQKIDRVREELTARMNYLNAELNQRIKYLMWMNSLTLALVVGLYVKSWVA